MKKVIFPLALLLVGAPIFAQTVSDVLRYSNLQPGGTARFLGAGGAFGALGAEFGVLSQNPAGLAMFRSDELVLTPSLRFSKTRSTLPGSGNAAIDEDKSNFGFDNFGLVFNTNPRNSRWKTFNVGLGMNRLGNFNQAVFYEGKANGTIMNDFFDDANATFEAGGSEDDLYPFGAGLAWDANALYADNQNRLSYDFLDKPDALLDRTHALGTFGRMNEMTLSFAGNYDEKLMVGATVGVPFVNYRIEGEYKESDPSGLVEYFDDLTYTEYLKTEGVGVNAKFGFIYRVNQMLRLGGAFHTPTFFGMTDRYSNTFTYRFTDGSGPGGGEVFESPEGSADYRLRTPWRAIASSAIVIKKFGFVSADVEWVDYGANSYNLDADAPNTETAQTERDLNNGIQRAFKQTMNVRLGAEMAIQNFRLRGGFNLLGKPRASDDGFNTSFSMGAGIRGEAFYLDLGYRRFLGKGIVQPYFDAPVTATENTNSDVLLTLGFKF
jgi:hypothetical protein